MKKMVSHSPWVPCLALFMLLLLPPSLLTAGSLQHYDPGRRTFHHGGKGSRSYHHRHSPGIRHRWYPRQAENNCQSALDLYFILDKSGSVNNNWIHIYSLVEEMVNKFKNPNMRMSFVLYSGDGQTLMPLTGDREEIEKGLKELEKVVPSGETLMQKGFELVNEQIEKVNSKSDDRRASTIIALTDGELSPQAFEKTIEQANKSRSLGAIVYTVGVLDYKKDQMTAVADSSNHTFGVDTGFENLKSVAEPLASKACLELTSVETSTRCTRTSYDTFITGSGFENAKRRDKIVCRYKSKYKTDVDIKATSFNDTFITCPGPVITEPYKEVFVEVSLNNGESFLGNKLNFTGIPCFGRLHDFGVPVSTTVSSPVSSTVSSTSSTTNTTVNSIVMTTINSDVRLAVRSPVTSTFRVISGVHFDPRFLALLPLLLLIPLTVPHKGGSGGSGSSNTVTVVEKTYDLRLLSLLPLLLLIPPLLYCCWRLCCMPIKKPPVPEKKRPRPRVCPPPVCLPPCPPLTVSCCGCGSGVMEDDTDSWCQYVHPSCHQLPLTWYHPGDQICGNLALMEPQCEQIPCSSSIVLQPSRECLQFTQPPCSPEICLAPTRECFPIPQELCTSGVCLQPARECLSLPQAVCTPRICPKPSRGCLSLNNYPQCQHLPPKCSQPPFSMLPLLSPSARKSIESLDHSCHPRPTSKRPKT